MIELVTIQSKLNAPKGKKNQFGNYNFRSVEDICEAVKPLLLETKCTLTFNDEIIELNGKVVIRATATITNSKGETLNAQSFAELAEHKGMSPEQCFGTASSYARKYAACGLLLCDDNTDPDQLDNRPTEEKPVEQKPTTKGALKPKIRTIDADNEKAVKTIKEFIVATKQHPIVYVNTWNEKYPKNKIELSKNLYKELEDYYQLVKEA